MTKRRVYELAKDYGMKGPEFVKVLKDLGFEKFKTHMAVLDDADQMVIEVRLEAAGFQKSTGEAEAAPARSPIRKKGAHGKAAGHAATTESSDETATSVAAEPADKGSPIRKKSPFRRKTAEETTGVTAEETERVETPETVESVETAASVETASAETVELPRKPAPPAPDEITVEPSELDKVAATAPVAEAPPEVPEESVREAPEVVIPEKQAHVASEVDTAEPDVEVSPPVAEEGAEEPVAIPAPEPETSEEDEALPQAGEGDVADEPALDDADVPRAPAARQPTVPPKVIRRLPQPEQRAKILGRIELPKETISDASRRSAPAGPRNPASVDRNLRQAALQQFRARGAQKGPLTVRRGPGTGRSLRTGKSPRGKADPLAPPPGIDPEKLVQVEAPVSVKKLSEALGHKVNQLLLVLMRLGVTANINSYLDKDQIELISLELGRNVEVVEERQAEDELISALAQKREETEEKREVRPPIVSFMGHVDHGKTTLLDALRGSEIVKGEAGGITQHIGAYRVERGGHSIVVLDTPGHAAFTQMRARGAQLTDIVVLVVAADDGVMPQTEEALAHARAAAVPLFVAVNKCDRSEANPMRVRQQLSALGVQPEEWGGQVQFVDISAVTGLGLDELVEKIALDAEILELRANPDHPASGTVIEAKQTPAQGNVISLVVLDGTLRRGDLVLCGSGTGRVRVMLDDRGNQIQEAPPGTPIEVLGLSDLPSPGDKFVVLTDTKMAKEVASQRATKQRSKDLAEKSKSRMMDLKSQLAAQKKEEVRLIIKADVMGSLEPIRHSLEILGNEEVGVRILHSALGGITETDVALADASDAIIVGFNSVPDEKARSQADVAGVTIRFYDVIYELIDDVKRLVEGLLAPEQREEVRGHAEIRRVFKSSKFGSIAGCFVTDGVIGRNHRARLVRDGTVIHSGKIGSLRREKDDAREVKSNFECGILLHNYSDIKEGDIIEAYEIVELQRTLGD